MTTTKVAEAIEDMVRDFTLVEPRCKSEVRRRLYAFKEQTIKEEGAKYEKLIMQDRAYIKHAQSKFLDGFAHPKDCEVCKAENEMVQALNQDQ